MKIEDPSPRKPPLALAKQGSLYHEMGERKWGLGEARWEPGNKAVHARGAPSRAALRDSFLSSNPP